MEDLQPRRWWLIVTAAVLAVLTLYYYTGSWVVVVLFFAAFALFVLRSVTRTAAPRSHACVRCGAPLNPNARSCPSCGSASWTIRN
ncbi:MAG: zinc ribbon domain-containing protein [Acidobacteriia bacterium]|nr:zinc ribbon domain-containing protein [Terriglobia bacterium]